MGQSRRLKSAGHVEGMGAIINAYNIIPKKRVKGRANLREPIIYVRIILESILTKPCGLYL
jgi:hypothetical protein